MRVSVVDSLCRVASSETLSASLAVDVIVCATVPCEMRGFVDEGSTPRVRASNRGIPEGTAKCNVTEVAGVDKCVSPRV